MFPDLRRYIHVDAKGLFNCLDDSLCRLGKEAINTEYCKMLGTGTDGASVNIAGTGLKDLVEKEVPWLYWSWCLTHRVELAVKDALICYPAYITCICMKINQKKCHELEEIIHNLKQCIRFDDAGIKPLRACGSCWVLHKSHVSAKK